MQTTRFNSLGVFLKEFIKNPLTVGALYPSSKSLAKAIVCSDKMTPQPRHAVELGPGLGQFSHQILTQFSSLKNYWAFEVNETFQKHLKKTYPKIKTVPHCATHAHQTLSDHLGRIDFVVSGLPFANMPALTTTQVLDSCEKLLRPGGVFSTFVYIHTFLLPKMYQFRKDLRSRFRTVELKFVIFNFPPAVVIECIK